MVYDYLVVGAGIYGATFAQQMHKNGYKVLVIDQRDHLGGNIYTKEIEGINVHVYGPHIFHTSNHCVWDYVNQFATFNTFINSPLAIYKNQLFNLPFNMNTFNQMWNVITPQEAMDMIDKQRQKNYVAFPSNLEEQAINLVGFEIYEKLIKGYTEKQWGRNCKELSPSIIKRLPVRFTYDNNYFNDRYQGIPIGGYTQMIQSMLDGIEVRLKTNYLIDREKLNGMARKIVYTGPIDAFYDYVEGVLEYRSLRFEHQVLDIENFQGNAVINYTEREVPYTRIIEHKHFEFGKQVKTVVSKEYPDSWSLGKEAYYPINDEKNNALYELYKSKTVKDAKFIFGGRLAEYKYYDMDKVIESALATVEAELTRTKDE